MVSLEKGENGWRRSSGLKNESESRINLKHGFYLGPSQDRFHSIIHNQKATTDNTDRDRVLGVCCLAFAKRQQQEEDQQKRSATVL